MCYGMTLLEAVQSGSLEDVDEQISAGQPIDQKDINGFTPLFYAAAYNFETITDILLMNGADPNATDFYGNTPLMCAAKNKSNNNIVYSLLHFGADITLQNEEGKTAYDFATKARNTDFPLYIDAYVNYQTAFNPYTHSVSDNRKKLTYDQIMKHMDTFFKMKYTTSLEGEPMYNGRFDSILLQIIGDKNNIKETSLTIELSASQEKNSQNYAILLLWLKSLYFDDELFDILTDNILEMIRNQQEEKKLNYKGYSISIFQLMQNSFSMFCITVDFNE